MKNKDIFEKCHKTSRGFFSELSSPEQFSDILMPIIESPADAHIRFKGQDMIMWSVNNYLGLANHPDIKTAALKAVETWGAGSPMGSRMMSGSSPDLIRFEQNLAKFSQKPASVTSSYGYLGVLNSITGIVGRGDTVIIDQLSHASIIDAAFLAQTSSGKRVRPFKHNNMDDLERQLKLTAEENDGGCLIVTEGVFGMHGDLANLPDIVALKKQYGARLLIDDAHGFGVMGKNGRGVGEHFSLQKEIDLYFATFAKAAANIGGFTAGSEEVIAYLRRNARAFIFTRALPMVIIHSLLKALEIIETQPQLRQRMWDNTHKLQQGLRELGYDLGSTQSPVTPVYLSDVDIPKAVQIIRQLREKHVFVTAVVFPVVPKNTLLIRMIPTAVHSDSDIEVTLDAFREIGKQFKLI